VRSALKQDLDPNELAERFLATRERSAKLVRSLSDADATVQSMEDASPAKWHLAHTSWFWETFLLREQVPGYRPFGEGWAFLFNSYYEAEGARIDRARRGMLSRPSLNEVLSYREHVTERMLPLCARDGLSGLIALGIAHEEQHQELLLTDIKHALFQNPLRPAMFEDGAGGDAVQPAAPAGERPKAAPSGWHRHPGGVAKVGHEGEGFAFDNEGPRHRVLLEPFELADRLVTNGEWQAFVDDGGYRTASLWLADGWAWLAKEGVEQPLYWSEGADGAPLQFTHRGLQPRDPGAPVTHISYYEADAYACWAGARLPTEFEWEAIASGQAGGLTKHGPAAGNQLDAAGPPEPVGGIHLFGDCWQHTRSSYLAYPRFAPCKGAVGEYNGKFMSGQFVLKGASCATVRGHSRASYRNFFYPNQRWQFTGLRLARDA
jgi:ergothioneine biosynthesis protein EgtB